MTKEAFSYHESCHLKSIPLLPLNASAIRTVKLGAEDPFPFPRFWQLLGGSLSQLINLLSAIGHSKSKSKACLSKQVRPTQMMAESLP